MSRTQRRRARHEILKAQNYTCFYCGESLSEEEATSDHVFPASLGYILAKNHVAACGHCNSCKGNEVPDLVTIKKAIHLYDKMGKNFNPMFWVEKSDKTGTYQMFDIFRSIGVKKFSLADLLDS